MPSKANYKKPALQRNKSMDRGIKRSGGQTAGFTKAGKPRSPKAKHGKGVGTSTKSFLAEAKKKDKGPKTAKKKRKPKLTQGYNARLDESLGMRNRGKKSQSLKSRRDESKGMEKAAGRRAYASVKTMDKGKKKRILTPKKG